MVARPTNIEQGRSIPEIYAEGLRYFMGEGNLNKTLSRLTSDLGERGIDYMVIGAVALLGHGYPRFTEDIDLVMTAEGLEKFHEELATEGIAIKVMTTGEYPGDGKPKPVSMPVPAEASTEIDGIRFVTLEKLIELKLASGISAPDRLKDLADVQELIKIRKLDADFAENIDPYVRTKYLELEEAVRKSDSGQE
jgi:hypothetical protein